MVQPSAQPSAQVEIPTVDDTAYWDQRQGLFRVAVHGSAEFASMAILPNAPVLLSHLDTGAHNRQTPLGGELRARLQIELATALERHGHQVATGITLLTHDELKHL
jgi:hypothetical protein